MAAQNGYLQIVELLLNRGANKEFKFKVTTAKFIKKYYLYMYRALKYKIDHIYMYKVTYVN